MGDLREGNLMSAKEVKGDFMEEMERKKRKQQGHWKGFPNESTVSFPCDVYLWD